MMAGIARVVLNNRFSSYLNPSKFYGVGEYDVREASYITRATAKLCQLGGSYGLNQATWCGYLAAQETNIWTQELVNPQSSGSPDMTALYAPIDLFWVGGGWRYADGGNPPGSNKFGQGPWREGGLLAIALTDAYDAFVAHGDTTNAAKALDQITKITEFIWSYGLSPDGGTFYSVGSSSDALNTKVTFNNYIPQPPYKGNTGYVGVTNGSMNVIAHCDTANCANFLLRFWAGAQIQIQGSNYNVASVDSTGNFLTLTKPFTGSTNNEYNFGNTCAITVRSGSPNVTGSAGCKFTVSFPSPNPYVGIVSGSCSAWTPPCSTGTASLTEGRVYGITVLTDTTATLVDHLTSTNVNFLGTSGTYTSFIYAPESPKNCGTSKSSYCTYGGGRDLSQDVCYGFAWMYAKTGTLLWQNRAKFCYNKQNGGQALGGSWPGAPSGYTVYARPGTIKVTHASQTITGIGTAFTSQFHVGDKILIGDKTLGGSWNNPYSYNSNTFYVLTIATIPNDTTMTISEPGGWAGASMDAVSGTGIFYNPADPEWNGADGGFGILGSVTPTCALNLPPCGGGYDFLPKYGKSLGMVSGAGNAPMGIGILGAGASATGSSGAAKARNP
jgi:hypothetical protein